MNPAPLPNINVNTHNEIHNNLPAYPSPTVVVGPAPAPVAEVSTTLPPPPIVEAASKGPTIRIETTDEAKVSYDPDTGATRIETTRPGYSIGSYGGLTNGVTYPSMGGLGGLGYGGLGYGGLVLG